MPKNLYNDNFRYKEWIPSYGEIEFHLIPIDFSEVYFGRVFWGPPRAKFSAKRPFKKGNNESKLELPRELIKYKEEIEQDSDCSCLSIELRR
jgi:hypothetical protein